MLEGVVEPRPVIKDIVELVSEALIEGAPAPKAARVAEELMS
jgi:hypothetical protein